MNFQSPVRLLVLVVVAALVIAYVVMQSRRKTYAMKFTNIALLDRVVTVTGPGVLTPRNVRVPIGTVEVHAGDAGVILLTTFYWCTNQQIIQRTFAAQHLGQLLHLRRQGQLRNTRQQRQALRGDRLVHGQYHRSCFGQAHPHQGIGPHRIAKAGAESISLCGPDHRDRLRATGTNHRKIEPAREDPVGAAARGHPVVAHEAGLAADDAALGAAGLGRRTVATDHLAVAEAQAVVHVERHLAVEPARVRRRSAHRNIR